MENGLNYHVRSKIRRGDKFAIDANHVNTEPVRRGKPGKMTNEEQSREADTDNNPDLLEFYDLKDKIDLCDIDDLSFDSLKELVSDTDSVLEKLKNLRIKNKKAIKEEIIKKKTNALCELFEKAESDINFDFQARLGVYDYLKAEWSDKNLDKELAQESIEVIESGIAKINIAIEAENVKKSGAVQANMVKDGPNAEPDDIVEVGNVVDNANKKAQHAGGAALEDINVIDSRSIVSEPIKTDKSEEYYNETTEEQQENPFAMKKYDYIQNEENDLENDEKLSDIKEPKESDLNPTEAKKDDDLSEKESENNREKQKNAIERAISSQTRIKIRMASGKIENDWTIAKIDGNDLEVQKKVTAGIKKLAKSIREIFDMNPELTDENHATPEENNHRDEIENIDTEKLIGAPVRTNIKGGREWEIKSIENGMVLVACGVSATRSMPIKELIQLNPELVENENGQHKEKESVEKSIQKEIVEENVFDKFQEEFGISQEDLKKIKGFNELSEGKQFLILENLRQLTLGRIKEGAVKKHQESNRRIVVGEKLNEKSNITTKRLATWKEIAKNHKKQYVKNILPNIWNGITKNFQIVKHEKLLLEEASEGGISVHGEILQSLVNGMEDVDLDVQKKENGKLEINYFSPEKLKNVSKEDVVALNQAANEYGKIPYEWSLDTATSKERKDFLEIKKKYEESKRRIFGVLLDSENKTDTALFLNETELKIELNRFFNNHPEVEKEFQKIKNPLAWTKALKNVATERGIYFGMGYAARTAMAGILGVASAPVVAAGFGAWRANKRANQHITETKKMSRRGREDKQFKSAVEDHVDVEYLSESINDLIFILDKAEKEKNDKLKKESLKSLKFHVEDAQRNLDNGTVNFGDKNAIVNQYELINKMSAGLAKLNCYSFSGHSAEKESVDFGEKYKYEFDLKEIEKLLKKRNKESGSREFRYKSWETAKGAGISAGFALGGALLRHYSIKDIRHTPVNTNEAISVKTNGEDTVRGDGGVATIKPSGPVNEAPTQTPPNTPVESAQVQINSIPSTESPEKAAEVVVVVVRQVIEGKINTYSEAAYEAVKKADTATKDNFIHKYLNDKENITNGNRNDLILKTVRKLSIANLTTGDQDDVKNLVYAGNVGVLKEDGSFNIEKGGAKFDPKAVSESELRKHVVDLRGNKGASVDEKDFGKKASEGGVSGVKKLSINEKDVAGDGQGKKFLKANESTGAKETTAETMNLQNEKSVRIGGVLTGETETIKTEIIKPTLEGVKVLPEDPDNVDNILRQYNYEEKNLDKLSLIERKNFSDFFNLYDQDEKIGDAFENIPNDLKTNFKLSLDYLKIYAGNTDEKVEGIRDMFDLRYPPAEAIDFTIEKNGMLTIANANNNLGSNILIDVKNNKIGLDANKSFGITSEWFGYRKTPNLELNTANLEAIKKMIPRRIGESLVSR